jgi:hypothetical protein
VRAGLPFSHTVFFSLGAPDAAVSWVLSDPSGTSLATGTFTPPVGSVSAVITIPGATNVLTGGDLFGTRFLSWSYSVVTVGINDEVQYDLEARVPFNVSTAGVRRKLGVSVSDVPDEDISLIRAYAKFRDAATAAFLDPYLGNGALAGMIIADAIEASAAVVLIPTMLLRVALMQTSGTDTYEREKADWDALSVVLFGQVQAGLELVNDRLIEDAGSILQVSRPIDAITGV